MVSETSSITNGILACQDNGRVHSRHIAAEEFVAAPIEVMAEEPIAVVGELPAEEPIAEVPQEEEKPLPQVINIAAAYFGPVLGAPSGVRMLI
jgi:hypothetical protein